MGFPDFQIPEAAQSGGPKVKDVARKVSSYSGMDIGS